VRGRVRSAEAAAHLLLSPRATGRLPRGRVRPADAAAPVSQAVQQVQLLRDRTSAAVRRPRTAPSVHHGVLRDRRPEDRLAGAQKELRDVYGAAADRQRG